MKEKRFGLGRFQTSFSQETPGQMQLKMLRVSKGGYVKGYEETGISLQMAGWQNLSSTQEQPIFKKNAPAMGVFLAVKNHEIDVYFKCILFKTWRKTYFIA